MGLFTTAMFVGSAKFLAKWIVRRYLPDEPWAEAIATELGGEAGKKSLAKIIAVLDTRLSVVARSSNPEFERENIKYAAVDKEVEFTLANGLNNATLADRALDGSKVLAAVLAARSPIGLGEAETELYKQVVAESVRIACEAASSSPKFRTAADRLLLDRSKETTEGVKSLQAHLIAMAENADGTKSELAEIKESLAELLSDASFSEFEYRYCASVIDELDEVRLFGIDEHVRPEARKQRLSTAYLSLNLTEEDGTSAPMAMDQLMQTLMPITRPYLLVRGDAGGGKSTLLKKLAIDLAQALIFPVQHHQLKDAGQVGTKPEAIRTWGQTFVRRAVAVWKRAASANLQTVAGALEAHPVSSGLRQPSWAIEYSVSSRIPFFVPLRRCRDRHLPPLHELSTLAGDAMPEAPKEWIERVVAQGRAIFLIDGLDEVAPQHRKDIDAGLESWFKRFGQIGNLFIVTSRPLVKDPSWVADYKFVEARVAPMSRPAREQFIDAWHKAAAEALESAADEGVKRDAATYPHKAERLKDKLAKRPSVARVASNPLMCAMICALSTDVNYDVDRSPREIIETLCRVLVHEREKATPHLDHEAFPACYRTLTPDQRLEILGNLALEMILSEMSVAGFDVLERHAKAMLGGLAGAKAGDAAELAATLIERSGLLVKSKRAKGENANAAPKPVMQRPDVDWIHATFKEFLAAEHFTASHEPFLLKNWERPDVRNVCVHLAAQRGTKETVDRLLTRILDHESSRTRRDQKSPATSKNRKQTKAEKDRQHLKEYLALRIDEAAGGKILPQMRKRLDALRKRLLPPASIAAAEALAPLGEEIIPDLRWSEKINLKPRVQQSCVRALRLIEHADAKEAITEYVAKATEMSVAGELAEAGVNPLLIPAVLLRLAATTSTFSGMHANLEVPSRVRQHVRELAPLAKMLRLQALDLSSTQVTDVTRLATLTRLQTLHLNSTKIADVSALARLVHLTTLQLNGTGVADLAPLAGLNRLETLELNGTKVVDVKALRGMQQLLQLQLSFTQVADVAPLAQLTRLQVLHLDTTPVADVAPLSRMAQLNWLDLDGTNVTDAAPLAGLTELERLYMSFTALADAAPLAHLINMRNLYLISTRLTDISPLSSMAQLQVLYLSGTDVADLTPLAELSQLQELYLNDTAVSDVSPLAGLKNLRRLRLSGTKVTDITPLDDLTKLSLLDVPAALTSQAQQIVNRNRSRRG